MQGVVMDEDTDRPLGRQQVGGMINDVLKMLEDRIRSSRRIGMEVDWVNVMEHGSDSWPIWQGGLHTAYHVFNKRSI
jgi:hypothetical protein